MNMWLLYVIFRCRVNDASQLKDLFTTARFARCRSRFVMPVLLFEGKVGVDINMYMYIANCYSTCVCVHVRMCNYPW